MQAKSCVNIRVENKKLKIRIISNQIEEGKNGSRYTIMAKNSVLFTKNEYLWTFQPKVILQPHIQTHFCVNSSIIGDDSIKAFVNNSL